MIVAKYIKTEKTMHVEGHQPSKNEEDNNRSILARLRRAQGQVEGIMRMVSNPAEHDCYGIINQCRAVKGAIHRVEELILETHLRGCVSKAIAEKKEEEFLEELLDIYKMKPIV